METWLQQIIALTPNGTLFVAIIGGVAFLEGVVGIGLIFPGAIITVFSGFLAYHGKGDIVMIMLAAGAGATCGDLLSYLLGARFGDRMAGRGLLRKHMDLVRKAELFFFDHGGKSIFFGRFVGPLRGLVPFIAGAARMRPLPLIGWALISGLLWGLAYPGIGYLGGSSWELARDLSGGFGMVILLSAAAIAYGLFRRHLARRPKPGSVGDP
jgi:undecaprenyl-diphosphatase